MVRVLSALVVLAAVVSSGSGVEARSAHRAGHQHRPTAAELASAPHLPSSYLTPKAHHNVGCCTEARWESDLDLTAPDASTGITGTGAMHYDAEQQQIVLRLRSDETKAWAVHYQNFTSGIEWVHASFDDGSSSCAPYALPKWSDFCLDAAKAASEHTLWGVHQENDTCVPVSKFQIDTQQHIHFKGQAQRTLTCER